jgi:hypothetical protein
MNRDAESAAMSGAFTSATHRSAACGNASVRRGMTTDRPAFMHGRIAMDKDVAASLLSLAKSLDDMIVKMFAEVEKFEDERAKLRFKVAVGDLMGSVARDIIFPLENAYPDLKTDL